MTIEAGAVVEAWTSAGSLVRMRALGRPTKGKDVTAVVWLCSEEEYDAAAAGGDPPTGVPWPLDAIRLPEPA